MQMEPTDTQNNNPTKKQENPASTKSPQGIVNKKSYTENLFCSLFLERRYLLAIFISTNAELVKYLNFKSFSGLFLSCQADTHTHIDGHTQYSAILVFTHTEIGML